MGAVPRRFWQAIEVIHDVVYFAPDIRERFEAIGLKGWWMAYFASRSAALGTPSAELVTALFYGFAPPMVRRALPDAWALASRSDVLDTRLQLARDALATAVADLDVEPLATVLETIVDGLDFAGRPLAAAHSSVDRPADAVGRLWWAASVLREYRGDSHVALLTTNDLDGAEANALALADGRAPDRQRETRGWSKEEWAAAFTRLERRGWVDAEQAITPDGHAFRNHLEEETDRVCSASFTDVMLALAEAAQDGLVDLARAIKASGAVTFPNPTGTRVP
jgi:hypothetical protein